jgi:hypothetical protein
MGSDGTAATTQQNASAMDSDVTAAATQQGTSAMGSDGTVFKLVPLAA